MSWELFKYNKLAFIGIVLGYFVALSLIVIGALSFGIIGFDRAYCVENLAVGEADAFSGNRVVDEESFDKCQVDEVLRTYRPARVDGWDKLVDDSLVPVYRLWKSSYENEDTGEIILSGKISALRVDGLDFAKNIEKIDGYTYQDVRICENEIIYKYKRGNSSGNVDKDSDDSSLSNNEQNIEDKIKQDNLPLGSFGRLYIPKFTLSVQINDTAYSSEDSSLFQQWAKFDDLSSSCQYGYQRIIYDLLTQGFWCLGSLGIDDCIYIKKNNDVVERYRCIDNGFGELEEGEPYFKSEKLSRINPGGLALYTNWDSVGSKLNIVLFQRD